jgi:membrane protein required for colicin V production
VSSPLDALLLILLVPFTVRGWWRGFCRESFGLVGLVAGALVAAAAGPELARILLARRLLPPFAALPVAWSAIFLAAWIAAAVVGRLADRLARALLLGGVNRIAGAVFGSLKGAALLGFGLLLVEHVSPSPALTRVIAASRLGRPLEQVAVGVVRTGRELGAGPAERRA